MKKTRNKPPKNRVKSSQIFIGINMKGKTLEGHENKKLRRRFSGEKAWKKK